MNIILKPSKKEIIENVLVWIFVERIFKSINTEEMPIEYCYEVVEKFIYEYEII